MKAILQLFWTDQAYAMRLLRFFAVLGAQVLAMGVPDTGKGWLVAIGVALPGVLTGTSKTKSGLPDGSGL